MALTGGHMCKLLSGKRYFLMTVAAF
uniref:Uncharacterized protein n=1 Tax=Arundo donax TaxID=35708 RepID=A0A0A9BYA2_ARUDO